MATSTTRLGRRQRLVCTWSSQRPGVKLRSDAAGLHAVVTGFAADEDGGMLEAERHGDVKPGYELVEVDGKPTEGMAFPAIIELLTASARPVTVAFLTPPVHVHKDRYGFVRDEEYVQKEGEYTERSFATAQEVSMQWVQLLKTLGGSAAPWVGTRGLRRDANGLLSACVKGGAAKVSTAPSETPVVDVEDGMDAHKRAWDVAMSVGCAAVVDVAPRPAVAITQEEAAPVNFAPRLPAATPIVAASGGAGQAPAPKRRSRMRLFSGSSLPPLARPKGVLAQLKSLVLSGVPAAFRGGVWYEMSGAAAKALEFHSDFYIKLVARGGSAQSAYDISKDVDRTYPGHEFFEDPATQLTLTRVLGAFAARNPDIGYCQSTNFLAGFLILLCEEDQAFWIMDAIVNELLPPNYYSASLVGVHADQRVLAALLKQWIPDVSAVLEHVGIDVAVITLEWFMALFTTSLPTHVAMRVWDAFLLLGNEVLFRVALALFWLRREDIMAAAGDMPALFALLQGLPTSQHDADELMQYAFPNKSKLKVALKLKWSGLSNQVLTPLRRKARAEIIADLEEHMVKKTGRAMGSRSPSPSPPLVSTTPPPPGTTPPPRALSSAALSASPPAAHAPPPSPPPGVSFMSPITLPQ